MAHVVSSMTTEITCCVHTTYNPTKHTTEIKSIQLTHNTLMYLHQCATCFGSFEPSSGNIIKITLRI